MIVFGGDKGQFTYSNPGVDPHNPNAPQPRLGNLDMAQTMKHMDGPGGGSFEEKERPGAGYYWHTTTLFY